MYWTSSVEGLGARLVLKSLVGLDPFGSCSHAMRNLVSESVSSSDVIVNVVCMLSPVFYHHFKHVGELSFGELVEVHVVGVIIRLVAEFVMDICKDVTEVQVHLLVVFTEQSQDFSRFEGMCGIHGSQGGPCTQWQMQGPQPSQRKQVKDQHEFDPEGVNKLPSHSWEAW